MEMYKQLCYGEEAAITKTKLYFRDGDPWMSPLLMFRGFIGSTVSKNAIRVVMTSKAIGLALIQWVFKDDSIKYQEKDCFLQMLCINELNK